jgi:YggT family protein
LKPFQRVLPLVGGVDLSPLLLIIILQVLLMVPVPMLEGETMRIIRDLLLT